MSLAPLPAWVARANAEQAERDAKIPAQSTAARVAALRERRAAEGLTRLELWARPEHHDRIRRYAAKLAKSPSIRQIPKVLDGT